MSTPSTSSVETFYQRRHLPKPGLQTTSTYFFSTYISPLLVSINLRDSYRTLGTDREWWRCESLRPLDVFLDQRSRHRDVHVDQVLGFLRLILVSHPRSVDDRSKVYKGTPVDIRRWCVCFFEILYIKVYFIKRLMFWRYQTSLMLLISKGLLKPTRTSHFLSGWKRQKSESMVPQQTMVSYWTVKTDNVERTRNIHFFT